MSFHVKHTFIRDENGEYWKYKLYDGFLKVKLKFQQHYSIHLTLPKIATYNSKLQHFGKAQQHRTTLLGILTSQRENIRELNNLKSKGKGSVLQGIFESFGDAVSTASETGEKIFHAIAVGLTHLTNDTVQVANNVEDEVASIFDIAGGPSPFALWILIIAIILYLAYRHILEYQMKRRAPELPPRG